MAINAPRGGKEERELVPASNHVARLYSLIHIGKIKEDYMGEEKLNDKVMLRFELPEEMRVFGDKGELPMAISREYTLSFGEKANLRKLVEGMLGASIEDSEEDYGLIPLIGKTCLLNVIHKTSRQGKEYAFIASAAPLPKKMEAPAQINPDFIWDFEENYNEEALEKMPDFIKDKIKSSVQYKEKKGIAPDNVETPFDDQAIPF